MSILKSIALILIIQVMIGCNPLKPNTPAANSRPVANKATTASFKKRALEQLTGKGNPCDNTRQILYVRKNDIPFYTLYDGSSGIRKLPEPLLRFPENITDEDPPACMIFSIKFTGDANRRSFSRPALLAHSQYLNPPDMTRYIGAAEKILEKTINSDMYGPELKSGETYKVAIPIWHEHVFFTGSTDQVLASELTDMGYTDGKKLAENNKITLYEIAALPQMTTFVAVISFERDEPITPYHVPGMGERATLDWIKKNIEPHIKNQNYYINLEVRLYAKGSKFSAFKPVLPGELEPYPPPTTDPKTGIQVDRAVGRYKLYGQRRDLNTPWEWKSFSVELPTVELNTMEMVKKESESFAQMSETRRKDIRGNQKKRSEKIIEEQQVTHNYLSELKKIEADYRAKGLVYRAPAFWAQYEYGDYLQNIFEGKALDARSHMFQVIYGHYQAVFYNSCRDYVPKNANGYSYTTDVYIDNVYSHTRPDGEVKVRDEFWKKFEEFNKSTGIEFGRNRHGLAAQTSAIAIISGKDSMIGNAAEILNAEELLRNELRDFIHNATCEGGLQQQFGENMRRIAYDEPILQVSKKNHPYVNKDSADRADTKKILSSCVEDRIANKRNYGNDWCRCLNRAFEKVLTPGEINSAVENYPAFSDKVTKQPGGGPTDPLWRYYTTANQCRR